MPSSYTHQRFAEDLLNNLPKEISSLIKKYPIHYIIGALGSDPLYFYKPLKGSPLYALSDEIHSNGIHNILLNNRDLEDEKMISYLFGLITHYVLDKNCHQYIHKIDKDGAKHHIYEAFLDWGYAISDIDTGKKVDFVKRIDDKGNDFSFIFKIFNIDEKQFKSSIHSMKRLNSILLTQNKFVRFISKLCLSTSKSFKKYKDIIFYPEKRDFLNFDSYKELHEIVESSKSECIDDIVIYYEYLKANRDDISFGDRYSFEGYILK